MYRRPFFVAGEVVLGLLERTCRLEWLSVSRCNVVQIAIGVAYQMYVVRHTIYICNGVARRGRVGWGMKGVWSVGLSDNGNVEVAT